MNQDRFEESQTVKQLGETMTKKLFIYQVQNKLTRTKFSRRF